MPSKQKNSFGDLIRDWESLLASCEAKQDLLVGLESVRDPLVQVLNLMRGLKAQQEDHEGTRQGSTQQILLGCETGREQARRLRGFIKSKLGTKSELLPQFGISPIRPRSKKTPPPPPDPAPLPPTE